MPTLPHLTAISSGLNSPFPYIAIPALPGYEIELDTFKAESFSFMLKTRSSRLLAYDLYLAQENYRIALKFVNERSRIHIDKVQPLLAQAGITNGPRIPVTQLENALGPFVLESIKTSTKNAITTVERSIDELYTIYLKFREYAIKEFKSTDFTEFKQP